MQPTKNNRVISIKDIKNGVRRGILTTRSGAANTPLFMPVGTRGAVKSLTPDQVKTTGAQIILGNTYHLHMQPGEKTVAQLGGLHKFMNWSGPILTDSGGFQVFSLAHTSKITEEGVKFKDPTNGDLIELTPEKAIQIQLDLGSDIIMAFDDVAGLNGVSKQRGKEAYERTHRWLERSLNEFKRLTTGMRGLEDTEEDARRGTAEQRRESYIRYEERAAEEVTKAGPSSKRGVRGSAAKQSLAVSNLQRPLFFGIAQGGLNKKLRQKSIETVQSLDVDGLAIGGLSVGEDRVDMYEILEFMAPIYDENKPHYLMGVGDPKDMRVAIENGIDMFDCVLPTRNARHGSAWVTGDKLIHLTNAKYTKDTSVIDKTCDCYTCKEGFSRGFLRHQFKVGEPLAGSLVSIHNIRYLERLCEEYRI
ncbi:MAG TPA: tRNA guanosine(34) transglycosylase Tgt [Candidatus Saccharibacteria bacterium]|nr:tRNA guanosine(34) transglycosylase Tgt [Candidatus Saccharibacteria bacterium]